MVSEDHRISIAVCGDGGCGKSSLILRLVRDGWVSEYDPTIEDSYSVTRIIDGTTYHLHIFDTAGQEEYRTLFSRSTLSADAFLLVYDITSPSTLDSLTHFTNMIAMEAEERRYRTDSKGRSAVPPVKMVVGNKCDLDVSRGVSAQEGLRWAKEKRATFMETSAMDFVNVEETFAAIIRRVLEARRLASTPLPTPPTTSRRTPSTRKAPSTASYSTFPRTSHTYGPTSRLPSSTSSPTTKQTHTPHIYTHSRAPAPALTPSNLSYLDTDPHASSHPTNSAYFSNPTRALTPLNASEISEKRTLAGGGALPTRTSHGAYYADGTRIRSQSKKRAKTRRTQAQVQQQASRHVAGGWSEKSRWDDETDDELGYGRGHGHGLLEAVARKRQSRARNKRARQGSEGTTTTSTGTMSGSSGMYSGSGSSGRSGAGASGRGSGRSLLSGGSGGEAVGKKRKSDGGLSGLFARLGCF